MADFNWLRTFTAVPGSTGSLLTAFDAGTASNFVEIWHYEGHTFLPACRFTRGGALAGLLRPDHVQTVEDDSNEHASAPTGSSARSAT